MNNLSPYIVRFLLYSCLVSFTSRLHAQANGDYRSKQTGNWNDAATWQTYNGSWVNASAAPDTSAKAITILANHTVTANTDILADQVIVNNDATLNITSNFQLFDGAGTDLIVNGTLAINNGNLKGDGNGEIVSGGVFNWSGGTNGGTGSIVIKAGAVFNTGNNTLFLADNKTINNYGTWNWTGGTIYFFNAAPVINNYGVFNMSTDGDISNYYPSTGTFNNQGSGIINKIGSPNDGTNFYGISGFYNKGTINVNSSTLRFFIPVENTGTINIAFGAGVNFTSNTALFNAGTTVTGEGNLVFDGANATVNAGTLSNDNIYITNGALTTSSAITRNSGQSLNLYSGTFSTTALLTCKSGSAFNWSGGIHAGGGTTRIEAGAELNLTGYCYLADTKTIDNYGTCKWSGYTIYFYNNSPTFNNYGNFNIETDAEISTYFGGTTGAFNNKSTGVINKIGSPGDETGIYNIASFTNAGTINIKSSKIRFNLPVTNTGKFAVDAGAGVGFVGPTAAFNAGTNISGAGYLWFENGTYNINAGSVSIASINQYSGTVSITPNISFSSAKSLNLFGGTLNGTANFVFNSGSSFYWAGGILGGSGKLTIKSGATLNSTSNSILLADTRIIDNYGTWNWSGGTIYMYNNSPSINNYGTFNINTDADFGNYYPNTAVFVNQASGIINKNGSFSDETNFYGFSKFTNAGIINVKTGALKFSINYDDSGRVNLDKGSRLNLTAGNATLYSAAKYSGKGTLYFDGATAIVATPSLSVRNIVQSSAVVTVSSNLSIDSACTFTLNYGTFNGTGNVIFKSGSTMNWLGGIIGGSGSMTLSENAIANLTYNPVSLIDNRKIENWGTINWSGSHIYFSSGSPVINNYGKFSIATDADVIGFGASTAVFNNKSSGIINKIGSPSEETAFSSFSQFNNEGAINIISGRIQGYVNTDVTGSINIAFGATFTCSNYVENFKTTSAVTGEGNFVIEGGTVNFTAGTLAVKTLYLKNGTCNLLHYQPIEDGQAFIVGYGTCNATGNIECKTGGELRWSGGTIAGNGSITINSGGVFNMNGGSHYLTDNKTIVNNGEWNWSSGLFYFSHATASIKNAGIFSILGNDDISGDNSSGTTYTNLKAGEIHKYGTIADESYINGIGGFSNLGKMFVHSGKLSIYTNGTYSGSNIVDSGAILNGNFDMQYTGKTFTNNGNVTFSGISFVGNSTQVLAGVGQMSNLAINNSAGVNLNGGHTINTKLILTNGKFNLSNYNLILAPSATLTGGTEASYLVTNGTGMFQRRVTNTNTPVLFPVGSVNGYMPVTIQLSNASTTDDFKIKVLPQLYGAYNSKNASSGGALSGNVVQGTWIITELVKGGSDATLVMQWNSANESGGFDRSVSRFGQYSSGWQLATATAATGAGPFTLSSSAISSFGPFGIINQFATATNKYASACSNKSINVPYNVVGSFNPGNQFTAQLSSKNGSFASPVNIGSVSSVASGSIAATIPAGTANGSAYRIRVISSNPAMISPDNGSNISISSCAVQSDKPVEKLKDDNLIVEQVPTLLIYPNPSNGLFNVRLSGLQGITGKIEIQLYTPGGQLILHDNTTATGSVGFKQLSIGKNQPAGVYLLRVFAGDNVLMGKVNYQK